MSGKREHGSAGAPAARSSTVTVKKYQTKRSAPHGFGWHVASCPTLPGCHSQGRTREEALRNVREAIRGYLASLREHGVASPPSSEFQVIEVRVYSRTYVISDGMPALLRRGPGRSDKGEAVRRAIVSR